MPLAALSPSSVTVLLIAVTASADGLLLLSRAHIRAAVVQRLSVDNTNVAASAMYPSSKTKTVSARWRRIP